MRTKTIFFYLLCAILLIGCQSKPSESGTLSSDSLTIEERALASVRACECNKATCDKSEEECKAAGLQGPEYDRSGFVVVTDVCPDIVLEMRYYSTFNFTGKRIAGYEEPVALLTKQAALALKEVSDELVSQGYRLKIFDAYRPQCAVDEFVRWARIANDTLMRQAFYPEYRKSQLFPEQFIASRSGHTRGSTVDLTLIDMQSGKELDMGTQFDYMGKASWTDLKAGENAGAHAPLTEEQCRNRKILVQAMQNHGWRNYKREWWHYTLRHEPYPHTYFNFPVRQ